MSIDAKHAYRFEYLKSDKWKAVRLEALVRERGKCQLCLDESIHHDAHHMWYPESIWDTTPEHLIVLCRSCHDFVHAMVPECKTNDENQGREHWLKFFNAIKAWRASHVCLFYRDEGLPTQAKELRQAYVQMKNLYREQKAILIAYREKYGIVDPVPGITEKEPKPLPLEKRLKQERADVLKRLEFWFMAYSQKELLTGKPE